MAHWACFVGSKLVFSGLRGGELYVAPGFRAVHVNDALRRPDPVILFLVWNFPVFTVDNLVKPFHAREVDSPLSAVAGGHFLIRQLTEHLPWKGDFQTPAAILIARIVDRAVDMHSRLESGDFPAID